jgi:hypothetical protein
LKTENLEISGIGRWKGGAHANHQS